MPRLLIFVPQIAVRTWQNANPSGGSLNAGRRQRICLASERLPSAIDGSWTQVTTSARQIASRGSNCRRRHAETASGTSIDGSAAQKTTTGGKSTASPPPANAISISADEIHGADAMVLCADDTIAAAGTNVRFADASMPAADDRAGFLDDDIPIFGDRATLWRLESGDRDSK